MHVQCIYMVHTCWRCMLIYVVQPSDCMQLSVYLHGAFMEVCSVALSLPCMYLLCWITHPLGGRVSVDPVWLWSLYVSALVVLRYSGRWRVCCGLCACLAAVDKSWCTYIGVQQTVYVVRGNMQIMYRIIFDKYAVFALSTEMCWPTVYTAMLQIVEKVDPLLQGEVTCWLSGTWLHCWWEVCYDTYGRNE